MGHPHISLGPGVPDPPTGAPVPSQSTSHCIASGFRVVACPILGGLPAAQAKNRVDGSVACKERLGGLLKYYHRDAA